MNLEEWPIDKLIPYVSNSRTHSDAQISQIAASIKEFGFTNWRSTTKASRQKMEGVTAAQRRCDSDLHAPLFTNRR